MPQYDRFIVVVMADEHAGSGLGLCNPDVIVEREIPVGQEGFEIQEWSPPISPTQQFIWDEVYLPGRKKFVDLANGDDMYILKLGEVCDGTFWKNSSVNLRIHEQVQIAIANMEIWKDVENLKAIRIVEGSRPHSFGEGSASRLVTQRLKMWFPNTKTTTHGVFAKSGFTIDYAHKGPFPGSRKHLEGNQARYYLTDYMIRELTEFSREPVDLVLRAHYHEPIVEFRWLRNKNGWHRSALIISPCMKFPGEYDKNVTRNRFDYTVGMMAVEVIDGEIHRVHDIIKTVDVRTWEIF